MSKWLVYILLFLSFSGFSQIKFNVNVSDRHLKQVERAKDPRAKLTKYKKAYTKDSLKASKKAWIAYKKQNMDSLKRKGLWKEAKANKSKILTGKWGISRFACYRTDSASLPPPKDSLDWALRELAMQEEFEQLNTFYRSYAHYDSAYLDKFRGDSLHMDSLELARRFQIKERARSYLPEGLAEETDADFEKQMRSSTIDQYGALKKIDRSGVQEFIQNIPPEEMVRSQAKMYVAKKTYSSLPNLEKEEEGIKRKSLEETPAGKRIFVGGHVTVQSTSPLILDSDVRVGYKLSRKVSAGVGFIIREQFSDKANRLTGDAHGYALFVNYDIKAAFFAYAEYQGVKNKSLFSETEEVATWEYAHLLGLGRSFQLGKKVSASMILLYDFNYKNNDLNPGPLMFRFGYQIGF